MDELLEQGYPITAWQKLSEDAPAEVGDRVNFYSESRRLVQPGIPRSRRQCRRPGRPAGTVANPARRTSYRKVRRNCPCALPNLPDFGEGTGLPRLTPAVNPVKPPPTRKYRQATPHQKGTVMDMYFDGVSYRPTAENVGQYFKWVQTPPRSTSRLEI